MPLSKHRKKLKKAIQRISEDEGPFPKSAADYMDESQFESKCKGCVFFQGGAQDERAPCSVVEGSVAAEGVCQLWIEGTSSNSPISDVSIEPVY